MLNIKQIDQRYSKSHIIVIISLLEEPLTDMNDHKYLVGIITVEKLVRQSWLDCLYRKHVCFLTARVIYPWRDVLACDKPPVGEGGKQEKRKGRVSSSEKPCEL